MALESCLLENPKSYTNSLEICLDRRYPHQTYKFKKPNSDNSILFNLKDVSSITKLTILSDIKDKELLKVANFTKNGVHDLELDFKNGVYTLYSSGDLVGKFRDKQTLKKYLSNYRVIYKNGKKDSDIDIKLFYKSNDKDNDYIKVNSDIKIKITSSKLDYYLAIFSLNREGKLFMIEPIDRYKTLKDYNGEIEASTKPPIGIDFVKVFLFKKPNSLNKLKVNLDSGEVLNDSIEVEAILNTLAHIEFYEATRAIRIVKE